MIIEQRLTDMVDIQDLPQGISRLTFAFESTKRDMDPFYARTSEITDLLASDPAKPVTALAEQVEQFLPLNPACDVSIFTDLPPDDVMSRFGWRARGGMPMPFANATDDVPVTPETLFSFRYSDERVIAFTTGKPVSVPFMTGSHSASAQYYDLDALAALLDAHPWVKEVFFDGGRPGDHDHVPASLSALVVLPQDVYDAYTEVRDSRNFHGSDPLFDLPRRSDAAAQISPLGGDPLGIASAVRTVEYQAPQEEWDYGPTFPDLEKKYRRPTALGQED